MERLFSRFVRDPATGCLEWQGATNSQGRGSIRIDGKTFQVHRVVWALANGEIPEGKQVLHRCDNPLCGELRHLFLGDHAMNMADMAAKGRSRLSAGMANPNAKLTDDDVRVIRASSLSSRRLQTIYGVEASVMRKIKNRKAWSHVQD
jgi:hypothetical protein